MKKYWVISCRNKNDFNHTLNTYVYDGWIPIDATFNTVYSPINGMVYTILLYKDVTKKC